MPEIGQSVFETADIASDGTTDIGATDEWVLRITGTTTITSFGTAPDLIRFLTFAAALTLTHNGTSLILPGGANIITAAGDCCIAKSDASGNWRIFNYTRASGGPPVGLPAWPYIAARAYIPESVVAHAAGAAPGAGSIRLLMFPVRRRVTISTLGLRVSTLSAGGNVQAAIYRADPATLSPTTLVDSTASMSTTTATVVTAALAGGNVTLEPGMYWLATNCDNGVAVFESGVANAMTVGQIYGYPPGIGLALLSTSGMTGLSFAQAFNTWPDLTGQTFGIVTAASVPLVAFLTA